MSGSPTISIVTATYNRSQVLAHAVRSVLGQTRTDWEHLIVGDACDDDTAEVVAAFGDPRLHFENLPANFGEQSGPNNHGVARARGEFLAFLNHDDMWYPEHLEHAVAALEREQADLVFSLYVSIRQDAPHFVGPQCPRGEYSPLCFVPASTWVMRRSLAERAGPWRPAGECHAVPSQDWLMRAWKSGASLRLAPRLTALLIQSGRRPGSYVARQDDEHVYYAAQMADAAFREGLLTGAVLALSDSLTGAPAWKHQARVFKALWRPLAGALGLPSGAVRYFFQYGGRRGGRLRYLRRLRGLNGETTR